MEDGVGSREELLQELHSLRQQVAQFRAAEAERQQSDELLRHAEEALRESEERFRAVFDNAAIGITLMNPEGWVLDCNRAMGRLLGYSEREMCNTHVADFTHPDDLASQLQLFQQLVSGEMDHFQMEKRYIRKGGEILWGRLSASLARSREGGPGFVVGIVEDITDQKGSEAALRESERRYRELGDSLPETVFEMDTSAHLTFVNRAGLEKFGYCAEDLKKGISVIDHIVPEDAQRAAQDIGKRIRGEGVGFQEYTALKTDGTTFPASIFSTPIYRDGKPVGLRGFLVDMTKQKQAEAALRESDARFRAIFQKAAIGVGVTDEDGRFLECNPALQAMLGYSGEALRQKRTADVTHPDDLAGSAELYGQLMSGRRDHYQIEKRFVRKDGEIVWAAVTVSLFPGGEGNQRFAVGMVEDITRRKEMEGQLLRAQRLETAGRVAGQVAHDFNNLLGPVTAYPTLMKLELPAGHPALEYCDMMQEAAERMAQINENLMALGRRGVLDEQPVDLNHLAGEVVRQLARLPKRLVVDLNLAPDLPTVGGSPAQLSRVITNLVTNAREAMEDMGVLSIATRNVYLDNPVIGYSQVEVGEYVRLDVSDTGCGIPHEIRDKIFDAFFTTKRNHGQRGGGLGLSIVQSVVQDHRGGIDLSSELGVGTTFSIFLPVGRQPCSVLPCDEIRGGDELVMVVDDDQFQQEVSRDLLTRLGYRVEAAMSGEEAVERLRDHPVDLLILDMIIPSGIDGAETYRRALKERPGQRAIIVSGFAESERVRKARSMGAGSYLRKPLKLETLARAVREELDKGAVGAS